MNSFKEVAEAIDAGKQLQGWGAFSGWTDISYHAAASGFSPSQIRIKPEEKRLEGYLYKNINGDISFTLSSSHPPGRIVWKVREIMEGDLTKEDIEGKIKEYLEGWYVIGDDISTVTHELKLIFGVAE